MRPRLGRRMVRTAVVGGAAYAVGSHVASKSAAQQQQDANQNAQINDLQQQQQQAAMAPAAPAMAAQAPQAPAAPPPTQDPIEAIKKLGELKAAGVLTDQEFEAKKAELLQQI